MRKKQGFVYDYVDTYVYILGFFLQSSVVNEQSTRRLITFFSSDYFQS